VVSSLLLLVMASLSVSSDVRAPGQPVSARTLSGDELVRIGEIHDVQNHFREALTYYDQALLSYRTHKQRKGEAIALTKIGLMFERQGRRQAAAIPLRQALSLFSKTSDSPVHADALFGFGRVSLWLGAREEAATLFEQAKQRYQRSHRAQELGAVRLQSGLLKVSDGSSDEGLSEIEQVLKDARTRRDEEQTLTALLTLGDAYWLLGRIQEAAAHYEQSLARLEQRPHTEIEAGLRFRMTALSAVTRREEEGVESAKRAVTLYQSLRDVSGEAAALTLLASLHHALGDGPEAEEALRRALRIYGQQSITVHAMRSGSPPEATAPRGSQ
jgi:tetratricopeptide (TPR) repeat protein